MSDKYLLDQKQQLLNNIGVEQAWGWSPAIDFCSLLEERVPTTREDAKKERNSRFMDPLLAVPGSLSSVSSTTETKNGEMVEKPMPKSKDELEFDFLLQGVTLDRHHKGKGEPSTAVSSSEISSVGYEGKEEKGKTTEKLHSGGSTDGEDEVHILLAGGNDIRHILHTISQVRLKERQAEQQQKEAEENRTSTMKKDGKEETIPTTEERDVPVSSADPTLSSSSSLKEKVPPKKTYHFYLYEPNLRLHCRHLFFLQWLLNSMFSLEQLEERVLMFLDVFGNIMMRDITAAQTRQVVQDLLRGLEKGDEQLTHQKCNENHPQDLMAFTSFTEMKLKEKDFVESQLRHWIRDASEAKIDEQWAHRLRKEMAERFDNRNNLLDWDFVFRLTDYTNLVKFPEYRDWRNTGVAFDVAHINPRRGFEYLYQTPNKTLCHFDRQGRGYYCGDVKNGPFFSFGAQTRNEAICQRTADGTCKYGNGVAAMHNLRAWCYTLMTGLPWPWKDHQFAWDDDKNYNYLPPGTPRSTEYQLQFPAVRFHFVGLDLQRFLRHVQEGRIPQMDAAFVGSSVLHEMTPEFFSCCASHAIVVAETAKFILDAEEEAKELFVKRIIETANESGWSNDVRLTARLHEGQPKPKKREKGCESKMDEIAAKRYSFPHQIALTKP